MGLLSVIAKNAEKEVLNLERKKRQLPQAKPVAAPVVPTLPRSSYAKSTRVEIPRVRAADVAGPIALILSQEGYRTPQTETFAATLPGSIITPSTYNPAAKDVIIAATAAKATAAIRWEEQGCMFGGRKPGRVFADAMWKEGVAPLALDYGGLDHYNARSLDLYLPSGKSHIIAEWPALPETEPDWTKQDARLAAYVTHVRELYDMAKTMPLLDGLKPGYVAVFAQCSAGLCRLPIQPAEGRGRAADYLLRLHKVLTDAGLQMAVKFGPIGTKRPPPEMPGVPYWRAGPVGSDKNSLINARLAVHARNIIIITSSVCIEFLLTGLPVIATGRSWFNGLGVFDEAKDWPDCSRAATVNTAARNKYMQWWTLHQFYPEQAPIFLKARVDEFERMRRLSNVTTVSCVYAKDARMEDITTTSLRAVARETTGARRIAPVDLASPEFIETVKGLGFEVLTLSTGKPPRMTSLLKAAIDAVKTPYIMTVECDVTLHLGAVDALINALDAAPPEVVAVESVMVDSTRTNPVYPSAHRVTPAQLKAGGLVPDPRMPTFCATLWRTDVLKAADWAGIRQLTWGDADLWQRILKVRPDARAFSVCASTADHVGAAFRMPKAAPIIAQRKCIYTVITGAYDTPQRQPELPGWDFVALTDGKSPSANWPVRHFDAPGLTAAQAARLPKICPHKFLPEYEYSLYVDSGYLLTADPSTILDALEWPDIAMPDTGRVGVYAELDNVKHSHRAAVAACEAEGTRYRAEAIQDKGKVYRSGIMARRHNSPAAIVLSDAWWETYQKAETQRDQPALVVAQLQTASKITTLSNARAATFSQMLGNKSEELCQRPRLTHLTKHIPDWWKAKSVLYIGANFKRHHLVPTLYAAGCVVDVVETFPAYLAQLESLNATKHYFRRIIPGDVRALDQAIGAEKYDVVIWWHGPEHIERVELSQALKQIEAASLGLAFIGCPFEGREQGAIDGNSAQAHRWSPDAAAFTVCGWEAAVPSEKGNNLIAWKRNTGTHAVPEPALNIIKRRWVESNDWMKGHSQHLSEFASWFERVRALRPTRYVEVGSNEGRSLWLIQDALAPGATIVSVDISDVTPRGTLLIPTHDRLRSAGFKVTFVKGDSAAPETLALVRAALGTSGQADCVFIDGDHSFTAVSKDYAAYRPVVRPGGIVGLHDIVNKGCGVKDLWGPLSVLPGATTFVHSASMGIGVLPC